METIVIRPVFFRIDFDTDYFRDDWSDRIARMERIRNDLELARFRLLRIRDKMRLKGQERLAGNIRQNVKELRFTRDEYQQEWESQMLPLDDVTYHEARMSLTRRVGSY